MICVQNRTNAVQQLEDTPREFGVEIDIRNHGDKLLVVHDPFMENAVSLNEWLNIYNHKFLIVNVKEEGLEPKLIPLLQRNNISDFFILDESIPYIRKFARFGHRNFALRVSEFESIETAFALNEHLGVEGNGVDWIWIDTFTGAPLPAYSARMLKAAGFKLCQVSPELHHVNEPESWEQRISEFQSEYEYRDYLDMVCTKRPDLWIDIPQ